MMTEITLYDRKIPYSIRKSTRAKRLRIAVYYNSDVVVTLPHHKTVSDVEAYLRQKSKWISAKLDYFREAKGIKVKNQSVGFEQNKERAYELALRIIKKFNKVCDLKYKKITIKSHKTKWGSCSKKGNLNFNYRIVFLPLHLAQYIVVHELCHLKELSHGRKYWNLVEKALPNYKNLIRELKNNY
ncbi:MAG: zinc-dependent protease [Candidatus Peregrinibacteria bacterium GW2011_GWE2_39_6]|nr:MAG: zinc-dependent protease [Candidatus Peregrinibacteria bacterium GW2011_GWF2_39_17]KKR25586.1 MAG: zinc-dependent protease [Candidatus Peregrinibacteria bacterium GW2011_GWE2_39_6]HCW31985.1 hypothetical protein [Candidatus Peregrinibacteria bacterium]